MPHATSHPCPSSAKKPSHILLTVDAITGVWSYALELARALRPHGIETTLAVMGPPPTPHQHAEASAVTKLHLQPHPAPLEWMPEPWADAGRTADWLLALEAEACPDLIHLNSFSHAALPWRAPTLVTAHSERLTREACSPGSAVDKPYKDAIAAGLQAANYVIAPTRTMADALCQVYSPTAFRCPPRVISPARCRSRFPNRITKRDFILTVAARPWEAFKNLHTLDAAAATLPWPLFLAGKTEPSTGLGISTPAKEYRHLDALGHLHQPDLSNWMSLASIYAHPATYEPFGLSILEAALSGCALVLSDIPSLREVWRDTALYVHPEKPRLWANTLQRLIQNAPLRANMGAQARRRALDYHPEKMAESYLEVYCDLLMQTPLAPTPPLPTEASVRSRSARQVSPSKKAAPQQPLEILQ